MTSKTTLARVAQVALIACCLGIAPGIRAATIIDLPFNEGQDIFVHDFAQGLVGNFGLSEAIPSIDTVAITSDSASGHAGDFALVNNRSGFLLGEDPGRFLDITNGPITIEAWIKVDPNYRQPNEGIAAYGASYKLGLRNRFLTFTLFGIRDIQMPGTNAFPVDSWVHVAGVWKPGVGADFYVTSDTWTTNNSTAYTAQSRARPIQHQYVSVASEGLGTALAGSFDRVRIHNRILMANEIDNDRLNPKAPYPETLVAYNFDEGSLPATNSVPGAPTLPLDQGNRIAAEIYAPDWTNDTPSGLPGDYALAFNLDEPFFKDRVNLSHEMFLGANNTNFTLEAWVKLATTDATLSNRMVLFRTSGPAPRANIAINTDRKIWSTIYGNTDYKSSIDFPSDEEWHHVAVAVKNYSEVKFYLDGVLGQTMPKAGTAVPSAAAITNLLVGMEGETTWFKGCLDRVRISDIALEASELDSSPIPLPKLKMESITANSFVLTWPASHTDYILEYAENLSSPTWLIQTYTTENFLNKATVIIGPGNQFYRLRK
jgi:hypothetical protein